MAADRDGERVGLLVDANADGVRQYDDRDGFGQRLTAGGTTEFTDVAVRDEQILGPGYGAAGPTYSTGYLQLIQLAVLARYRPADRTRWVVRRTRGYTHSAADLPRHDPLVQQVIGRLSAAAFSARATVLAVDDVLAVGAEDEKALVEVELMAARAQLAVIETVLPAMRVGRPPRRNGCDWTGTGATPEPSRCTIRRFRKARTIGDHLLNGVGLPFAWSAGERYTAVD